MALLPHIVHVVGHSEAHHAATAADVIEACGLARRAIENALQGAPVMSCDPAVQERRAELVDEARMTLKAIQSLATDEVSDPWSDPGTLRRAVTSGVLDAPQLRNNSFGQGSVRTRILHGACLAVDQDGNPLSEAERLASIQMEA
jgi:hypothetical protein